jgi:predicted nucleic acid-binding protein
MTDADPTRVVADADVLAADLLVGGDARDALDHLREHSWLTLVASDPLLDDAEAVVTSLADERLAADWRERIERECESVDHPDGDHPGLASAYRGRAAHLLTFDEGLGSAGANLSLSAHMQVSIRTPHAFARLFDAAALYEATHDDAYPGPDRDPRA